MGNRIVYMDHNATTPLHPEVKRRMTEALEFYGNPSSLHTRIADFIGAEPDEIIFVGSGSEACNTILSSVTCPSKKCDFDPNPIGSQIVTTEIEHPAILESAKCLADQGISTVYLGVDAVGKIDLEQLERLINDRTRLVSVMMANNEIGTYQDIEAVCKIVHDAGALFHTDAVQAVGKTPVDVKELGVDFLSFSGHKIYGPKGIGVMYVKRGVSFCPLIRGGHQEEGRRAGTENTLGIIGLGKAVEMRQREMESEAVRLRELKGIMRAEIEENIPDVYFIGHAEDSIPGTLNVSFAGAEGEAILLYLDLEGIAVSTGSACASGSLDPSHVILATGVATELAHGSIRISMGRENTIDDVRHVTKTLKRVIEKVRGMSTVYNN